MFEHENHICKCCGNSFSGIFCNLCGQKVISRFSLKHLWNLLHEDLLEVDRGFWHTMKDLTLNPGKTIKNYLNGNTKRYFSPVKYLLIISALIYFLLTVVEIFQPPVKDDPFAFETWKSEVLSKEQAPFSLGSFQEITNAFPFIMKDYLSAYFLLILPFAAFAGQFVFRNLNFTELLITWVYLWGHVMYLLLACSFLISPVVLLTSDSMTGLIIIMATIFIIMFYFFTKTFRDLTSGKWVPTFIKLILTMYSGFFTVFALAWVALGIVKLVYQG